MSKKVALSGVEKTAILMNILGKEKSLEIVKELGDPDIRNLFGVMGSMKKAPISMINEVLKEYLHRISERDEIIFEENLGQPSLVTEALGEERAKQIFGNLRKVARVSRKYLTVLEAVDPKALAEFLHDEHPQTIALILAHMDLEKQMVMFKSLPDGIRAEVILRMANLEHVAHERIEELDEVLKKELLNSGKASTETVGGVSRVAELVNGLDKRTMNSVMARLDEKDAMLAEQIRQNMFTFTDIAKIDDRGVQLILREVANDRLMLALKSAPEELREKIYSAMSSRASEMLREDLQAMGPQKVSDVEAAQREIVALVKRLEDEGRIVIGMSEENEVIP